MVNVGKYISPMDCMGGDGAISYGRSTDPSPNGENKTFKKHPEQEGFQKR